MMGENEEMWDYKLLDDFRERVKKRKWEKSFEIFKGRGEDTALLRGSRRKMKKGRNVFKRQKKKWDVVRKMRAQVREGTSKIKLETGG